jgi:hypothetical protein
VSRRALLGAVLLISSVAGVIFAKDPDAGSAKVFTPPASASELWEEPVIDPLEYFRDAGPTPVFAEAPAPAPISEGELIIVPPPEPKPASPEPVLQTESGLTIRIGPNPEEKWCELNDFSYARWRPVSLTQWMPGHRDRFGMLTFAGDSAVAWEDWGGLASTHGYAVHFLNGPVRSDLPSKLFDLHWGLHWNGEITPGWSASLSGKVGLFTDFEDSVRDGWRFPAHAVVFHDWTETIEGVAGVKYLDRENLPPLPVLGVILRPDDRVRLEAIFPEPRVAWRVHAESDSENWLSLSGEIGGGEWAIERSNTDLADVVTYNDYSAVLGFHHYMLSGTDIAFEIGYVFARDLEYRSGAGDFQPDEAFFIRWSSHF